MQAMDVLYKNQLAQGCDNQLSDLSQIEKCMIRKINEKATFQSSLGSYFCTSRKDTS